MRLFILLTAALTFSCSVISAFLIPQKRLPELQETSNFRSLGSISPRAFLYPHKRQMPAEYLAVDDEMTLSDRLENIQRELDQVRQQEEHRIRMKDLLEHILANQEANKNVEEFYDGRDYVSNK